MFYVFIRSIELEYNYYLHKLFPNSNKGFCRVGELNFYKSLTTQDEDFYYHILLSHYSLVESNLSQNKYKLWSEVYRPQETLTIDQRKLQSN